MVSCKKQTVFDNTSIHPSSKCEGEVIISMNVTIGQDSYLHYGVEVGKGAKIGRNVHIGAFTIIPPDAIIPDNVCIDYQVDLTGLKEKLYHGYAVFYHKQLKFTVERPEEGQVFVLKKGLCREVYL